MGRVSPSRAGADDAGAVPLDNAVRRIYCLTIRPSPALPQVHRRTVAQEVLDRLVEFISSADTPTTRLLPEHVLCERLGVSRAALREALAGLGHLGIIETRRNVRTANTVAAKAHLLRGHLLRGALTSDSPHAHLSHAMEARRLLESPMARLAAQRATPQDLQAIQEFAQLMQNAPDRLDLVVEYDSGFHVSIARATNNPVLVHIVSAIADALASTRQLSLHAPGGTELSVAGHSTIVDALVKRDPVAAERAMHQHLTDVAGLIDCAIASEE